MHSVPIRPSIWTCLSRGIIDGVNFIISYYIVPASESAWSRHREVDICNGTVCFIIGDSCDVPSFRNKRLGHRLVFGILESWGQESLSVIPDKEAR